MDTEPRQTISVGGTTARYVAGRKLVIFSTGFGVRAGSPGMDLLTDIANVLPKGVGHLLFSYCEAENDQVRIKTLREDAERLLSAVAWARQQPGVEAVAVIAHSRGCIDAAIADIYPLGSVIMLAPPLKNSHAREYFTNRPGAEKRGDDWHVPRSDGTTSIMSEQMFDEYEATDLQQLILDYASRQPLHVVAAGADRILGDLDYSALRANPNISMEMIQGASHDFDGISRSLLLQTVCDHLAKDLLDA